MTRRPFTRGLALLAAPALAAGLLAGCGSSSPNNSTSSGKGGAPTGTLRIGYLPNLNQASAILGLNQGIFAKALGKGVTIKDTDFNAGPAETQALFSGAIDAAFIGPSPAVNGYVQSHGQAVRVISGATSGGAGLVVADNITSPSQLKGTKLDTPQLGNTQDVALRYWLKQHGLTSTTSGGGEVSIQPEKNSDTVELFGTHQIQGAWVPEPYLSEMLQEGGHLLVNEASLWPHGQFATVELVVTTSYLKANPQIVDRLLKGLIEATDELSGSGKAKAETAVNSDLDKLTGKALTASVLKTAFGRMQFTWNPLVSTVLEQAKHAVAVGLLSSASNLDGLFDLAPLNSQLTAMGKPTVKQP